MQEQGLRSPSGAGSGDVSEEAVWMQGVDARELEKREKRVQKIIRKC